LLNFSRISDSDILLIRFSCRLKIAAGTTAALSVKGIHAIEISESFVDNLISRSYAGWSLSGRLSFSRSLSLLRSRSRYLAEVSPVVTADLDGVGLTRCGNPREREGCGVGGDLDDPSFLYLDGDNLSGERRLSTNSCARFGVEAGYDIYMNM
jgi:hypothetical protein